jgi:hypothetical protein
MTICKLALRGEGARRELTERIALATTVRDKRHNVWALELLDRRNAVARWRGQPSCSLHEVVQVLDGLLA